MSFISKKSGKAGDLSMVSRKSLETQRATQPGLSVPCHSVLRSASQQSQTFQPCPARTQSGSTSSFSAPAQAQVFQPSQSGDSEVLISMAASFDLEPLQAQH